MNVRQQQQQQTTLGSLASFYYAIASITIINIIWILNIKNLIAWTLVLTAAAAAAAASCYVY